MIKLSEDEDAYLYVSFLDKPFITEYKVNINTLILLKIKGNFADSFTELEDKSNVIEYEGDVYTVFDTKDDYVWFDGSWSLVSNPFDVISGLFDTIVDCNKDGLGEITLVLK